MENAAEVLFLKSRRMKLMSDAKKLTMKTMEAIEESNKIESMIRTMRLNIVSGSATDTDMEDYTKLVPVLTYKCKVMDEERIKREKDMREIVKEIIYIDELLEGED